MNLALESIQSKILMIRGQKVILDRDLAALYGVETRTLKQAVRRNSERFPDDFMFELTDKEFDHWRSQNVMSNHADKMGLRYKPFAFTEHGALQAANVIKSETAKEVSISIIRVFNHMRKTLATHEELKALVFENQEEIKKIRFEIQKLSLEQDREERSRICSK